MKTLISMILDKLWDDNWDVTGIGLSDEYNDMVVAEGKDDVLKLLPPNNIILCVGNSRKKWEEVKQLLADNVVDPFDSLSENTATSLKNLCDLHSDEGVLRCQVFYTHSADPFLVSFQRLAAVTDVGIYHKESHMVIHKCFGPWFALRFALVLQVHHDDEMSLKAYIEEIKTENQSILSNTDGFTLDDNDYQRVTAIIRKNESAVTYDAHLFLEARKSFSHGKCFMYDDEQVIYHYNL